MFSQEKLHVLEAFCDISSQTLTWNPAHSPNINLPSASKVHYWLQIGPLEVVRVEGIVAIAHHKRSGRCWNLPKRPKSWAKGGLASKKMESPYHSYHVFHWMTWDLKVRITAQNSMLAIWMEVQMRPDLFRWAKCQLASWAADVTRWNLLPSGGKQVVATCLQDMQTNGKAIRLSQTILKFVSPSSWGPSVCV